MIWGYHYFWKHPSKNQFHQFHQALINVAAKAKDLGLPGGRFPSLGVVGFHGVYVGVFLGPPCTVESKNKKDRVVLKLGYGEFLGDFTRFCVLSPFEFAVETT